MLRSLHRKTDANNSPASELMTSSLGNKWQRQQHRVHVDHM